MTPSYTSKVSHIAKRGQSGAAEESVKPRNATHLSAEALEIARSLQKAVISPVILTGTVRIVDILAIVGIGVATLFGVLSFENSNGVATSIWQILYLTPIVTALILTLVFFQVLDLYQLPVIRTIVSQCGRIIAGWTMVFAVFSVIHSFTDIGDQFPQNWFAIWYATTLIGLLSLRIGTAFFARYWTRTGRLERRAVIVGGGQAAADLIQEIESQPGNDIRICGIFDDRGNDRSPAVVSGYPKLGTVANLVEFGRIARVDMLIVTIPLRAEKRVLELLQKLWVLPVDIRLSAHTDKARFRERASSFIGTVPFFDVVQKPIADWDTISKRSFDIFFATLALLLLFPVMIGAAIAVRLDSKGPIFFRQKRYGFNNEVIDVLKFRSMYHEMADPTASKVVTRQDPRVTKVGRFIRRTSIDELPQLFNVLRGELSLVGPRPHAVNAHTDNHLWEQVVDGYFARHKVKPGVTGWAQINGWRGEVDKPEKIQKRVEYDIYYIENWSVLFDLYILIRTPFALLNTKNAY